MNIKTIITILSVIFVIFGLMWWGKSIPKPEINDPNISDNSTESILVVSEKLYDFGAIKINGGNVETKFKITNPTNKEINLESITTSCMCTVAYIESVNGEKGPFGMVGHGGSVPKANEIIKAGESRDIKVVYDPMAHGPAGVGQIDRFIYLTDDSGSTLQLEIKALVTP